MTYKNISELPPHAQVLPILGQKMWMRVFNRAIRTYSETQASKTAWTVLRQFYTRQGTKWVKRK